VWHLLHPLLVYGSLTHRLLLFTLWIPVHLNAQQPTLATQAIEDLLYSNETEITPEALYRDPAEPGLLPLNLNSSSPEELENTGLFTPYQLNNLLEYREKYGKIYSIYELAAIPGFDPSKLKEIQPFIMTGPDQDQNTKVPLHHMLMIDIGRSLPVSRYNHTDSLALENSAFAGSLLKTTVRIRSHPLKNLSLAVTYDKDTGEPFLYGQRPQFLSGYLCFTGNGTVKQLVAGNFRMNLGLGLVNGAGFIHQADNLTVNRHSLSILKPYASKSETMFEQGIACQLNLNKVELITWVSGLKLSLSPDAFTENTDADRWLEYQRTTGLFRTTGESEGRDLALKLHWGIQAVYRINRLAIGIMSSSERIFPTKKAMQYLPSDPGPSVHRKASLHGNWQKNRIQLFGELASGDYRSMAFLLGMNYYFNDFIQGGLLLHHYGSEYRGSNPSSYSSGSEIKNEQGVAFHLHVETGRFLTAEMTGELFRYPSPRYLTNVPSTGSRLDLTLGNPFNNLINWRFRVVSKSIQTTPPDEHTGIRPLQDSRITRLDARLSCSSGSLFNWQSRLVVSLYSHQQEILPGYALLHQITLGSSRKLKTTFQVVLFQVAEWENRIYLYEPGLYYSFTFPALYGQGQKSTLLLTLKPLPRITISAKISGVTNRNIPHWESALQLRVNL
jgi:hypothetical protein